jgi:hypothetical protein
MKSLSLLVGVCLAVAAKAQQFRNLDFEQAKVPTSIYTWDEGVASLFPGWTLYPRIRNTGAGALDSPIPGYNSVCLGSQCIQIFGPPRGPFDPVDQAEHGKFSVLVDSGGGLSGGKYELGLEQVGLIPSEAKTLLWSATDKALLRIDGSSLDPVLVGGGTRYPTWGVDVSSWAGLVVDLKIGASGTFNQFSGVSYLHLDYLRFSEVILVPEPAPFALTALGVAALVWARRRSFPR